MGGFVLTSNSQQESDIVTGSKKVFKKHKIINFGDSGFKAIVFEKNLVDNTKNYIKDGDDIIIGVGTFNYRSKFGVNALTLILNDLNNGVSCFDKILGHFNIITYVKNELKVVTDCSGFLQLFQVEIGSDLMLSTSFSLLCSIAPNLTLSKQEVLEYLQTSTTFNNKTIFKEITVSKSASILSLFPGRNTKTYFTPKYEDITYEELLVKVKSYFKQWSGGKIIADLSGGFDTRTLAASLMSSNCNFEFVTNNRSLDISKDILVSKKIAKQFNIPLHIAELENNYLNDTISNVECVYAYELSRGMDISKRVVNEIYNKANINDLIFGGWGAEMLRNTHGQQNNVRKLISGFGYNRFVMPKDIEKEYLDNLEDKLIETLNHLQDYDENFIGEIAFYRFKSKDWVGSALSARNKYAHWLFPFFDIKLAIPIINLEHKDRNVQKRFIKDLKKEFESITFGNGDDFKMIWNKIKRKVKKVMPNTKNNFANSNTDYQYESVDNQHKLIYDVTKINKDYLKNIQANRIIPRYDALSVLLNSLESSKLN